MWLTFRNQSVFEIIDRMKSADLKWVFISLVLSILALFSRAYRWNLLIHPLGHRPKLINTFYALMIGYFANLAIPRIGEISRCAALNKAEKVPFDKLIGTVIIERVSDVIMLMVSILMLFVIEYDRLGSFLDQHFFTPIMNSISHSGIWFALSAFVIIILIWFAFRLLKQNPENSFVKKANILLSGVIDGLKSILTMKNRGVFLAHTLFIWSMYFLMTYVSFFALESTSALGPKAGVFIMVIGGIAMSAPVQGGIGAYHFLVKEGLLLYGIAEGDGIVFATLVHTWQLILSVVLGLLAWLVLFVFPKKKLNESS